MGTVEELRELQIIARLRGRSWAEVCKRAGLTRDRAGRLARGERRLRDGELDRIRAVLGIDESPRSVA